MANYNLSDRLTILILRLSDHYAESSAVQGLPLVLSKNAERTNQTVKSSQLAGRVEQTN